MKRPRSNDSIEFGKLVLVYTKANCDDFVKFVSSISFLGLCTKLTPDIDVYTEFVDEILEAFVTTSKQEKPDPKNPDFLQSWKLLQRRFENEYDEMLISVEKRLAKRRLVLLMEAVDSDLSSEYKRAKIEISAEEASNVGMSHFPPGRGFVLPTGKDPAPEVSLKKWYQ